MDSLGRLAWGDWSFLSLCTWRWSRLSQSGLITSCAGLHREVPKALMRPAMPRNKIITNTKCVKMYFGGGLIGYIVMMRTIWNMQIF